MNSTRTVLALAMFTALAAGVFVAGCSAQNTKDKGAEMEIAPEKLATAYFAGGCFWCTESDFEKVPGVTEVISGYAGGHKKDPTYSEVSAGTTGHQEAVKVVYDPAEVSYADLLDWFWKHVNPTDPGGQFVDRGEQYTSVIFYENDRQKALAEESRQKLDASGIFDKPVVTKIKKLDAFYPAEEYHQDYYKKHGIKYRYYRWNSGRDQFLEKVWEGDPPRDFHTLEPTTMKTDGKYVKPPDQVIRERLNPLQYRVTQEEGTEPPFRNDYWDNHEPGIYVDIVSGEPLFSSTDKYESGTGWPSFTRPLEPANIVEKEDRRLFSVRTEVRSRHGDSHLGHVFNDGPPPTGLRYCMNSAALRFVPAKDLDKEGYGQYARLFQTGPGKAVGE